MLSPRKFFPLPFSSIRCVFRPICSNFSPFDEFSKISDMGIIDESSQCGGSAIHNDLDNKEYITVGSISVPLNGENMRKHQLSFPGRCKPSGDKQSELMSRSNHSPSTLNTTVSGHKNFRRRTQVDLESAQLSRDNSGESSISSNFENNASSLNETLLSKRFRSRHDDSLRLGHFGKPKDTSAYRLHNHKLDSSVGSLEFKPFDICFHGKRNSAVLGNALQESSKNKESCVLLWEEAAKDMILSPGMVLLKRYLTHDEQVEIVNKCRELGVGPGGFYRPGYADGAKLRLQMMCLGLDWDPQTRKYREKRLVDASMPPSIPLNFSEIVKRAIQKAHCLIKTEFPLCDVEDILPSMSPDVCIVNFYNTTGRLGLHQDRDESRGSIRKGLPVVSFSIGDSAEFLYGDQRDPEMAERVVLESGDVLIFGGESRLVYHGVSSIIPNSAPQELLKDTRLSPGRLNLTFRQY